jgi:hypothetical protein
MAAGLLVLGLGVASAAFAANENSQSTGKETSMLPLLANAPHDFDFLIGHWRVHHRRLKQRLAGSHEWEEFAGESLTQKTMGGFGTIDDNILELPDGTYRAAGLRGFDTKTGKWSIWWLDGRNAEPPIDPPVRGGFKDGVGTFEGDDTFNGKPIRVRYTWSEITPTTCHWEQAFSPDGGATWETNWVMDFERIR